MMGNPSTAEAAVALLAAHGVDTVFVAGASTGSAALDAALRRGPLGIVAVEEGLRGAAVAAGFATAGQTASVFVTAAGAAGRGVRHAVAEALPGLGPVLHLSVRRGGGRYGALRPHDAARGRTHAAQACTAAGSGAGAGGRLADALAAAFRHINRQRPGPFFIELGDDELASPYRGRIRPLLQPLPPAPDHAAIAEAARRLDAAERPAILIGRGGEYAIAFLDRLAGRLQAPVIYSQPLNPLLGQARPLTCGPVLHHPATHEFLAGCDVVLALGDALSAFDADTYDMAVAGKVVHFSPDYEDFCSGNADDLTLVTEIGAACERLLACAGRPRVAEGRERAAALCRAILAAGDPWQVELAERIVHALPDAATLVATPEMLALLAAAARAHPGARLHRALAVSDAALTLACASGAALADPETPHVAIVRAADIADLGGDLRAAQALPIAAPVVMVDCRGADGDFFHAPALAACGCTRLAIGPHEPVESALAQALAADAPAIIEFMPAATLRRHSRRA